MSSLTLQPDEFKIGDLKYSRRKYTARLVDAFQISQFYTYFVLFLLLYVMAFIDFVLWQNKCMLITVRLTLENKKISCSLYIYIQSNWIQYP